MLDGVLPKILCICPEWRSICKDNLDMEKGGHCQQKYHPAWRECPRVQERLVRTRVLLFDDVMIEEYDSERRKPRFREIDQCV
jgi:hypothetical protein